MAAPPSSSVIAPTPYHPRCFTYTTIPMSTLTSAQCRVPMALCSLTASNSNHIFKLVLTALHWWLPFSAGHRAGTCFLWKQIICHCSLCRRHLRGNTPHGLPGLQLALWQPSPSGHPARVKGRSGGRVGRIKDDIHSGIKDAYAFYLISGEFRLKYTYVRTCLEALTSSTCNHRAAAC